MADFNSTHSESGRWVVRIYDTTTDELWDERPVEPGVALPLYGCDLSGLEAFLEYEERRQW